MFESLPKDANVSCQASLKPLPVAQSIICKELNWITALSYSLMFLGMKNHCGQQVGEKSCQFLADQKTLSQPEGAHYVNHTTM